MTAQPARCKDCGIELWWLRQDPATRKAPGRGGLAPIETAIAAKGNITVDLERETYRIVPPAERKPGEIFHLNHFARCPRQDQFRR